MTGIIDYLDEQRPCRSPGPQNRLNPIGARFGRGVCLSANAVKGLTQTIEEEIIPYRVMTHKTSRANSSIAAPRSPGLVADSVSELVEQMLENDVASASVYIEALWTSGYSFEDIFIRLLAPAANFLRDLWSKDLCGFAQVALALWSLQQLLRKYSVEFRKEGARKPSGYSALLAPSPREGQEVGDVVSGLALVSTFLRRDGWEVWTEFDTTARGFSELIRSKWFDVVEFLVESGRPLDNLASKIRMIRRSSPNRSQSRRRAGVRLANYGRNHRPGTNSGTCPYRS